MESLSDAELSTYDQKVVRISTPSAIHCHLFPRENVSSVTVKCYQYVSLWKHKLKTKIYVYFQICWEEMKMRELGSSAECPLRAPEATGTNYKAERK